MIRRKQQKETGKDSGEKLEGKNGWLRVSIRFRMLDEYGSIYTSTFAHIGLVLEPILLMDTLKKKGFGL